MNTSIKVKLLEHTPYPEHVVARAANQCYAAGWVGDTYAKIDELADSNLIRKIKANGHTSVLEHASFTFAIEGISRACSHQLVRFRLASYSQQSQRYVRGPFPYITPPSLRQHEMSDTILDAYDEFMAKAEEMYKYLVSWGIPNEDARFVLPNATETKIVQTMNCRELLHFFTLRCCVHAQWEIRELANNILNLVRPIAPTIFGDAGPNCVRGFCTETERSCKPELIVIR